MRLRRACCPVCSLAHISSERDGLRRKGKWFGELPADVGQDTVELRLDRRAALTRGECVLIEAGGGTEDGTADRADSNNASNAVQSKSTLLICIAISALMKAYGTGAVRDCGGIALFVCRRTDRRVGKCSNRLYGRPLVKRRTACKLYHEARGGKDHVLDHGR
jgi:hypothetical protein